MARPRVARYDIVCETCGGTRAYTATQLAERSGRYCSKQCANKAISQRPEYREKRRLECLNRPGHGSWMIGKKMTEKNKAAIKAANVKGGKRRGWKVSEEGRRKMVAARPRGEKCHLWKGGITPEVRAIRTSFEYKLWREAVFKRDNFTCVFCGVRGQRLNADHIKPFSVFKELRFDVDNGRTLCVPCHKATPTYGNRSRTIRTVDDLIQARSEMTMAASAIQKTKLGD